ncbi:MAG: threonine--tRNA ligase [Bacillota bacterium]|nr:threonine--tRNA ligase [Bacillota bacterium]
MNINVANYGPQEVEAGLSLIAIAKNIDRDLAKKACAAKMGGQVVDLRSIPEKGAQIEFLTFDDPEGRLVFNHTASHIMAQAVKRLYPNAKLAIGPAIEDGFYYDFDVENNFTQEDLAAIEAEMKKIVKENLPLSRYELPPEEAIAFYEQDDQDYKVELIQKHAGNGEDISFYKQGEFDELCAGPHLMSTGSIKAYKLTHCAGAYWHGDSSKPMLCRVYGTAFPSKEALEEHMARLEEARKRDHNKIGRELEYFTTAELIGQGLPILLPKGAKVIQILQRFIEDEECRRGWQITKTPYMAKSDLYVISGHWDHYRDGMFILGDPEKDEEVYALRPMTCPFQYQAYLNRARSYRDLPLRYNETSTLFRNESSGEMHGLIRVRQFTISEGHLMCTPEQLEEEFKGCLELAIYALKSIGLLEDVSYRFSQWDPNNKEKYIGTAEQWDEAQGIMKRILDHLGLDYKVGIDEAAFYGPKLDIQIKNVWGKEDTLITIQIDQMLAEKFGMEYTDTDGSKKNPYIIHRTSIGCYERTLALLLEKFAGALPLWYAPVQVKLLPIADRHLDYLNQLCARLQAAGIRAEVDARSEKIGYKIRAAQMEKIPYMIVAGDKDIEENKISVRSRSKGELGAMDFEAFLAQLQQEIADKVLD